MLFLSMMLLFLHLNLDNLVRVREGTLGGRKEEKERDRGGGGERRMEGEKEGGMEGIVYILKRKLETYTPFFSLHPSLPCTL